MARQRIALDIESGLQAPELKQLLIKILANAPRLPEAGVAVVGVRAVATPRSARRQPRR